MPVVNKKSGATFDVYIGRGSKWGNPFSHLEGTKALYRVASREEAIAEYRKWLWLKMSCGDPGYTLQDVAALHGKTLGCFCAPLPCHGDVLMAAAAWAIKQL
jgi:hypothetical protein